MTYQEFIKSKAKKELPIGWDVPVHKLNPELFDFQKSVVSHALKKGRFLLGEDAGMGKSIQQLEWSKWIHELTGGDILIVAPLGVSIQTANEEAPKFGYKVNLVRNPLELKPGINITNYEIVENFKECSFAGVVLDESSILKNFTGATRLLLKEIFKDTPYKLACSATPAPNKYMELLNQADWLGVMETSKALSNYFINDMKTGEWRLKGHATDEFWKWVCSWALMIDKPSDIGFDDSDYQLPELKIKEHIINIDEIDHDYEDGMFRSIELSATGFHKEKKRTAEIRAMESAKLINNMDQYLIWCDTNTEADFLKEHIKGAVEVRGSHSIKQKEDATMKFKSGEIRLLISKPSIFGYGMNFQNCHNAIFCGLTYSYEEYYQALKRFWRFGQDHVVNIWIVLGSTELEILKTVREKEARQIEIKNQMRNSLRDLQILELQGKEIERVESMNNIQLPQWLVS